MLKRTFNQRAKHDFEIREPDGCYRKASEDEILETALNLIDVRTLDHILVAEETYSFSEHGMM